MEGHASIATEVLSRYAADAVQEVPGVKGLVERQLPHRRGVRLENEDGRLRVELRIAVEWGASIPEVAGAVQRRVRNYLAQMADVEPESVDVVVDEVAAPSR
jgi:uncharacterized alkaline shock family protein YloU